MSVEANFASAEIELVIHATEDRQKVLSIVEYTLGIKPEEFVVSSVKGHFGNEITLLKANINGKKATEIAYKIAGMMSDVDKMHVYDNFDLYVDDKNSLYIRISKQKLFERKIVLSQADALKIKLKTVRRFQPRSEMESYRKFLVQKT
jgi:RNA binding exosome subunit